MKAYVSLNVSSFSYEYEVMNRITTKESMLTRPISDADKDRTPSESMARAGDRIGWRNWRAGGKLAGLSR